MTFKNQKEEVIEIELTSYGKHLLSKGKFRPTFYAFFDDDVLYDAEYAGTTEEQNYAQTRVLEETPRLRVQTTFTGLETEIERQIEQARTQEKKLKDSFQSTKERHYALSAPLGRSTVTSDFAPSWDVTLHGANFQQQLIVSTLTGSSEKEIVLPIPQMNLESLDYKVKVISEEDNGDNPFGHPQTATTNGITQEEFFDNGNAILITHKDIVIEVDEMHTDSLSENYDIEIFIVEENETTDEEILVPLSFIRESEGNVVNGFYVERSSDALELEMDESYVENYLNIMVDKEIDIDDLCRLGYRTDYSKRGHIPVDCGKTPGDSEMPKIYENIDSGIAPFGDDC